MKLAMKSLCAALLLTATASVASAQPYWYYYESGPMARGYYGTPYGGGPQNDEDGGGDQYGYGPGLQLCQASAPRLLPLLLRRFLVGRATSPESMPRSTSVAARMENGAWLIQTSATVERLGAGQARVICAAKLLTKDEARRIAANITKLPELLQKA